MKIWSQTDTEEEKNLSGIRIDGPSSSTAKKKSLFPAALIHKTLAKKAS